MGAMKRFYTAAKQYDRETRASLCPHHEWRQRSFERAAGWEEETRRVLADNRSATPPNAARVTHQAEQTRRRHNPA